VTSRWLWITPDVSTPLTKGGLVYSHQLAHALASVDGDDRCDVEVVAIGSDAPDPAALGWPHATLHYTLVDGGLRPAWRSLVSRLPNQTCASAATSLRRAVAALLEQDWDVVLVDGLRSAWALPLLDRCDAPVVFLTHNHESSMRAAVAREHAWWHPRGAVLRLDALKTRRWEQLALERADVVTAITEADRRRFEQDAPSARHVVLRPGWTGRTAAAPVPIADRPRRVVMMGSFDWHVKQEDLRRFVRAADPVFARAGVELVVGGTMPDTFRAELEQHAEATVVAGWIDDPATFLTTGRLGVVAEALGGGFKLKSLDYVFNGVPLACLTESAAGLPLRDGDSMVERADEGALARAVVEVIDDHDRLQAMADRARVEMSPLFSWEASARLLAEAVDSAPVGGAERSERSVR